MKAKLAILRHGQTEYNKDHRMTGRHDVPLTDKGREQGREVGRLLDGIRFDVVYASTLSRAFNTAALALGEMKGNEHLKNPDGSWKITQSAEIIEGDVGIFTGRCSKTDPEVLAWRRRYNVAIPGGESDAQVVARVQKFYDAEIVPLLQQGKNVVIFCHAGIVRAFDIVLGVEAIPTEDGGARKKKSILNASPTVYDFEDGKVTNFYQLVNSAGAANQNAPPPPKINKGPTFQ